MKKLRFFDSLKFVRFIVAVACVFAIVPVHAATLPAGYTELEYLESTGTQYINTGIYPTNATETMVVGQYTELSGSIFGALEKNAVNYYGLGLGTDGMWHLLYGSGATPWVFFGTADTNKHTFLLKNKSLYIDNLDTPAAVSTLSCNTQAQPMFLFGANLAGEFYSPSKTKIFSVVIKNNNSLVRNFVPARRDSDGVLGMYDLADSNPATAFYTNQGSGSFTTGTTQIKIATTRYNEEQFEPVQNRLSDAMDAVDDVVSRTMIQAQAIDDIATNKQTRPDEGCTAKYCLLVEDENGTPHWYPIAGANGVEYVLPAGYTQLEYIESDGYSWIIVPYRVNNKTVFYARYNEIQKGRKVASAVFGVTSTPDTSKANYGIVRLLDGTNNFNRMGWGDSTSGSVIGVDAPKNLNTWYEVLYDQNKLYQDNVLYATSATSNDTEWVANYDLGIFARNSATVTMPAIAKISSVWAKEDGEYKINLVPAKNSSGDVGLYDLVSGQFFTKQGTGVFGEGPVVE